MYYPPVILDPTYFQTYMPQQPASPKAVLRADVSDFDPTTIRKVQAQDSSNVEEEIHAEPEIETAENSLMLVAPDVGAPSPEVKAPAPEVEAAAPEVEAAAPEVEAAAPLVVSTSNGVAVPSSESLASRMLRSSQRAAITGTLPGALPTRTPQSGMIVADFALNSSPSLASLSSPASPSSLRASARPSPLTVPASSPVIEPSAKPIPQHLVPEAIRGVRIGDEIKKAVACERLEYRDDPSTTLAHRVSWGVIKEIAALGLRNLRGEFTSENFIDNPRTKIQRSQGKKVDGERVLHFTVQKGVETKTVRAIFRNSMVTGRNGKESSVVNLITVFYCKDQATDGTIISKRFYSDISEVTR
jgi:hypothetical protein